jgi:hypothetical protein
MGTIPFKPFSLEDDAFVQGGLLQDVDVQIVQAQWVPWDYGKPGVVGQDILAVRLTLQQLAEDHKPVTGADGQPIPTTDQFWSGGGNFSDVIVTDDGYMAGPGPNKSALTRDSNFHLLLKSFRDRGMPKGYMEGGSLKALIGLKFHLIRVPAPKREGLTNSRAEREGEKTIPVCGSILQPFPWGGGTTTTASRGRTAAAKTNGAPAPATNGSAATTTNGSAAPVSDEELEATAEKLIRDVLSAEPDQKLPKLQDLKVKVFRKASTDRTIAADKRNLIGKLAENGAWLESRALALVDSGSGEVTLI